MRDCLIKWDMWLVKFKSGNTRSRSLTIISQTHQLRSWRACTYIQTFRSGRDDLHRSTGKVRKNFNKLDDRGGERFTCWNTCLIVGFTMSSRPKRLHRICFQHWRYVRKYQHPPWETMSHPVYTMPKTGNIPDSSPVPFYWFMRHLVPIDNLRD